MASPRIRSLKHTFFSDEKLAELPLAARYTFAGLIAHADDEGRLKGDPRLIKAQVWPLDDYMTSAEVANQLDALASGPDPRIRWYRVAGRQFIEIVNFRKHQYIQKPKPSELPASSSADASHTDTIRLPDAYRLDGMGLDGNGAERMPPPLAVASPRTAEPPRQPTDDPEPLTKRRERDEVGDESDWSQQRLPPSVTLPPHAEQFIAELYGAPRVSDERRRDVRRQLMDAIDPAKRGARLRHGVYVRARDADHLGRVCLAVRCDPPQSTDGAIVVVLRKLQDAETDANGRTVTEAASVASRDTVALEERYHAAAKGAANAWVAGHRDAYEPIKARLVAQFGDVSAMPDGDWRRTAYDAAHLSEVRKASGFPDFDTWALQQARASPRAMAKAG